MPDDLSLLYNRISGEVTARADRLWATALELHGDPEIAFEEHRAARLLTGELEAANFQVNRGVADMPTAFTARTGGPGRCVALLLEYDALPGLGHACGHNLIAAAGLGAALALGAALGEGPGTVLAVGTPAEESGGGKVLEADAGLFEGVDAALMFHPGTRDWSYAPLTAHAHLRIGFHGKAAHPTGNPTEGIDALAALIQLFNTLAVLERRLPSGSHAQGIVTEGGRATNIVPEYAEGLFGLRGATTAAREELAALVEQAAQGVAAATGTTVRMERAGVDYDHFRSNDVLAQRFAHHIGRCGIAMREPEPGIYLGSSDIGNVSVRMPAIHPFVAITDPDASDHTPEFATAAAAPRARDVMLASATALACTAADILRADGVAEQAWGSHRAQAATEA
jgi:amidohydrolase